MEGGGGNGNLGSERRVSSVTAARPGGLMMCDIFNAFRPHNHRPHSRPITEGPFLPPPPHGRRQSHEERCIIQQPPSRTRCRGDRHRRARLIFTGPPGGGLLFAAASRRTTRTDHAPLLAPPTPECCSLLQPYAPPHSPPTPPGSGVLGAGHLPRAAPTHGRRRRKVTGILRRRGGRTRGEENRRDPLTSTEPPGRQT